MDKKMILLVSLGVSTALAGVCGAIYVLASRSKRQKPILAETRTAVPVKVFTKDTWGAD